MALTTNHRLFFAWESAVWSGGIAFIDQAPSDARTVARAYLITREQLIDVISQENGNLPAELDLRALRNNGSALASRGRYGLALFIGEHQGHPMVSITTPVADLALRPTAPAAAYVRTIADGLRATSAMDDAQITAYLGRAGGCTPELVHRALAPIQPSDISLSA